MSPRTVTENLHRPASCLVAESHGAAGGMWSNTLAYFASVASDMLMNAVALR